MKMQNNPTIFYVINSYFQGGTADCLTDLTLMGRKAKITYSCSCKIRCIAQILLEMIQFETGFY